MDSSGDIRDLIWVGQCASALPVVFLLWSPFCVNLWRSYWWSQRRRSDFLMITTDSVLHLSAWICVNQINMFKNWSRMGESLMGWAQALYAGSLAPYSYSSSIRSSPWAQNSKQPLSTISVVKDSNSQTKTNAENITTNNLSSDHSIGPLTQLVYFYEKGG